MHAAAARPEVILPAYGCPDLVAAAVHTGVVPVLVDIRRDDPAFAADALCAALNDRTVAVVAVNFLGIRERLPELRQVLGGFPHVCLIEDDAQWFPVPDFPPTGDFVCLSFGRGKPVSLLGGGALLARDSLHLPGFASTIAAIGPDRGLAARVLAYNLLRHPRCYGLVSRNPLFRLGATEYQPLRSIEPMSANALAILPANVEQQLSGSAEVRARIAGGLDEAMNLPLNAGDRCGQLLRYPVLCADRQTRDRKLQQLQAAGLGATAMYGLPLAQIPRIAELASIVGEHHGAVAFSNRLLTLPLHDGVTTSDAERMVRILRAD
ncbi:MAG: DegT/DnrJ/EryC1/StrS family aminotransferase [Pseudomonadota bacterium]|nr:DegT/DnrJ/EryC1/StrS family aminotransferase [Pseudomonadota bacterium]